MPRLLSGPPNVNTLYSHSHYNSVLPFVWVFFACESATLGPVSEFEIPEARAVPFLLLCTLLLARVILFNSENLVVFWRLENRSRGIFHMLEPDFRVCFFFFLKMAFFPLNHRILNINLFTLSFHCQHVWRRYFCFKLSLKQRSLPSWTPGTNFSETVLPPVKSYALDEHDLPFHM